MRSPIRECPLILYFIGVSHIVMHSSAYTWTPAAYSDRYLCDYSPCPDEIFLLGLAATRVGADRRLDKRTFDPHLRFRSW